MGQLLGVVSAVALLAAPLAAAAQSHGAHGGGHWSGGHLGGGHWGGGRWAGGGSVGHGGWRGPGGFHGYRGYHGRGYAGGYFLGGLGLGLALGAYPWYYGGPGYYDYYGPAYDSDPYWDYGDVQPPPAPQAGAPAASTPPSQACGSWSWRADQNRYVWVPAACGSDAPPPADAS